MKLRTFRRSIGNKQRPANSDILGDVVDIAQISPIPGKGPTNLILIAIVFHNNAHRAKGHGNNVALNSKEVGQERFTSEVGVGTTLQPRQQQTSRAHTLTDRATSSRSCIHDESI